MIEGVEGYESIPRAEIEKLMDRVYDLPSEICDVLIATLTARTDSGYEPISGVGIHMPEDEQRRRIPHMRFITVGLLERLLRERPIG